MTTQKTTFEQWWQQTVGDSDQWTTLERSAALDAWNAATKSAAKIAQEACLVLPDGGSPTQEEADICEEAKRRILSYNA